MKFFEVLHNDVVKGNVTRIKNPNLRVRSSLNHHSGVGYKGTKGLRTSSTLENSQELGKLGGLMRSLSGLAPRNETDAMMEEVPVRRRKTEGKKSPEEETKQSFLD